MTVPMTSAPIIKLAGTQLAWDLTERLLTVSVERGLRRCARAEISFDDPGFAVLTDRASSFSPGSQLTVAFPAPDGSPRQIFTGTVTGLRVSSPGDGDHQTAFTIVAEDSGHGLAGVQKSAASTNTDLTTALRSALSAHHSGSIVIEGLPPGARDAVLVSCSPLDLLEQICERYGVEWWVDPADGSLHVAAAPTAATAVTLTLGDDLRDLDFHTNGSATGTVILRGWDPATKKGITGQNSRASAASGLPAILTGGTGFAQADTAQEYQARALSVTDSADVTAQATAHARRTAVSGTRLMARTVRIQPGISPRDQLTLAGAGPLSGNYPVVAVRHDWGAQVGTTIIAGDRSLGAVPVPAATSSAPSPVPLLPSLPPNPVAAQTIGGSMGLLPGLVTDINDPKSWGRVKVKLPGLGDDVQTGWARTVLPAAGPKRGFVVPHRVNDEVLVGFEEGDLQRPVVLGAVHNGKDTTPAATSGRSADLSAGLTSANGHLLVVTDATDRGTNGVNIKHAAGHQIQLSGEQVLIKAEQGTPLKLQSGQASITLDAQGNVAIKGVSVTVTGQSAVDLKGPQISAKADAALTLQGSASTTIKGATVAVTADAMASIKGATVAIN
jgi:hypothetical protein